MSQTSIRVLHITASSMIGGGPEHVWQLIRKLPQNIQSFVAAPNCEPYGQRFKDAVGQERFLSLPQRKFTLNAFKRLVTFIKLHNIDIIHSHGKGAGIYARLASLLTQAKSVHTFHGIHLPQNVLFRQCYMILERVLCRISTACIAVSDGEAQEAEKCGFGYKKLHTIRNGVLVPPSISIKNMHKPFTVLHVSRFDTKQKNSLFLCDIALALQEKNLLRHCHFLLVGEGEELTILQENIARAGFEQFFTYAGRQASVQPFYEQAACLLSTSRWEGLPLAVLEAQAQGVPAIVTDVVGNRDAIIHDKTGFLYNIDDATTAATHIETLLNNEKLWQDLRMQAYTLAEEQFSVEKMAEATGRVYSELNPK